MFKYVICKISAILFRPQCSNSSPPSAAYMRQWIGSALVQIMTWRLFGAKPLSKQCWNIVNWTLRNKLQWNFNQSTYILIQENAFEIVVCKMVTISSQSQCVNTDFYLPLDMSCRSSLWVISIFCVIINIFYRLTIIYSVLINNSLYSLALLLCIFVFLLSPSCMLGNITWHITHVCSSPIGWGILGNPSGPQKKSAAPVMNFDWNQLE